MPTQLVSIFHTNAKWYQARICEEILKTKQVESGFEPTSYGGKSELPAALPLSYPFHVLKTINLIFFLKFFLNVDVPTQLTSRSPTNAEWYQACICEEILTPNRLSRDSNQRPMVASLSCRRRYH